MRPSPHWRSFLIDGLSRRARTYALSTLLFVRDPRGVSRADDKSPLGPHGIVRLLEGMIGTRRNRRHVWTRHRQALPDKVVWNGTQPPRTKYRHIAVKRKLLIFSFFCVRLVKLLNSRENQISALSPYFEIILFSFRVLKSTAKEPEDAPDLITPPSPSAR